MDFVKIKVTGHNSNLANVIYDIVIAGIENPTANLWDFPITIRTEYEDLTSKTTNP